MPKNVSRRKGAALSGRGYRLLSASCLPEFMAWVEAIAKHERIKPTALIERALVRYGQEQGHPAAPPRL